MIYLLLGFFLFTPSAQAYIPPAHYLVKKLTAERESTKELELRVAVYKPGDSNKGDTSRNNDELLFNDKIQYNSLSSTWPVWQIFYADNEEELKNSIQKFGIKYPSERDLTKYRNDQLLKLTEMPTTFYKQDESTSMRRFANTVVWQISNKDKTKSILIEKDSFLPLSIVGPCPEDIGVVCSVDFPRGRKDPKIYFRKDKNILFVVKVFSKESTQPDANNGSSSVKELFVTVFK